MIVPMKKISLIMLESERKQALFSLRKLGLVHLEQLAGSSSELSELNAAYAKLESVQRLLSDIKLPKNYAVKPQTADKDKSIEIADEILDLYTERKDCENIISADLRELERISLWGDVDPADFSELADKGIFLAMYEISADKYKEIPENIKTIYVNGDKQTVRFLIWTENNEKPADMPADAFAIPSVKSSSEELRAEISASRTKLMQIAKKLVDYTAFISSLKNASADVSKEIELENAYSGMKRENGEHALAWITGFVPADGLAAVLKTAKEQKWAAVADDPADDDLVPTKLKNNRFVRLIYPVSDFLGTVPGYSEYDISGWFLLFFSIFFGMIFGDGGYGLLMVCVALIAVLFSVVKRKTVAPALLLLFVLGAATMLWGTATCTWFGLSSEQLPEWLKNIAVPYLSNAVAAESAEKSDWVSQNLQVFCFSLALIQLSVAHIKGIRRYIRSLKWLGELGSMAMLWGLFAVVLNMVVDSVRFPLPLFAVYLIAGGFVLNFIFSNYEGNILQSVLASCKNIVSVLLGVVNIFSDIVSYIRLWAVGLAGSAISSTVNDMAGPTLGGAIMFLGIILLVFGHGLNMVLNVLSVIVHGVRLNTLEFSNHLGMSWSGFKYEPFCE
ncbi:MAG: hypothetical protein NC041_04380 [Bacteroides sp.]|nr:hypothetical protein [Prevotella sp.]MCM1407943.1 ATPase [Treponema brennaborense]MCM1469685.1 hypothetical protein [Bacteroides sp.]